MSVGRPGKCCLSCVHRMVLYMPEETWVACRITKKRFLCSRAVVKYKFRSVDEVSRTFYCEKCPSGTCPYYEPEIPGVDNTIRNDKNSLKISDLKRFKKL